MNWIKITPETELPSEEVLCGNFKERTYGFKKKLFGWLAYSEEYKMYYCEYEGALLGNITHFMIITNPEQ